MTLDKAELKDVIERLEKADGPDREIDSYIYYDILGYCRHANRTYSGAQSDTGFDCDDCGASSWGELGKFGQRLYDAPPNYTASVDAAIALTERMLPGWARSVSKWHKGDATCVLTECHEEKDGLWWHNSHDLVMEAGHKTEQLAILLALFKALLAKEE